MPSRRMVSSPSESEVISPTSRVTYLSDLLTTAFQLRQQHVFTDAHDVETHESLRLSSLCASCIRRPVDFLCRRVDREA